MRDGENYAGQVNRLADKVQQQSKRSTAALKHAEEVVKQSQAARKKALELAAQFKKNSLPDR